MTKILEDRVMETTTTTGTGSLTVSGAVPGFRTFDAACVDGDTFDYSVFGVDSDGVATGEYETGLGTQTSSGVLARTTVYKSSNADAHVNFGVGGKYIMMIQAAQNVITSAGGGTQDTLDTDLAATDPAEFYATNDVWKFVVTEQGDKVAIMGAIKVTVGGSPSLSGTAYTVPADKNLLLNAVQPSALIYPAAQAATWGKIHLCVNGATVFDTSDESEVPAHGRIFSHSTGVGPLVIATDGDTIEMQATNNFGIATVYMNLQAFFTLQDV